MTRLAPDPLAAYAAAMRAVYDVMALPRTEDDMPKRLVCKFCGTPLRVKEPGIIAPRPCCYEAASKPGALPVEEDTC